MTIDLVRMSLTPSGQAGAEHVGTLAVQVGISSTAFGDIQRSSELPAFDFAQLDELENFVTASVVDAASRERVAEAQAGMLQHGRQLFEATLGLWGQWPHQVEAARRNGRRIRIEISTSSGLIAAQPWEFLSDPATAAYLALDPRVSITRNPVRVGPMAQLSALNPIRILLVGSTPDDQGAIDVGGEFGMLVTELSGLGGAVEPHVLTPETRVCTFSDLEEALTDDGPWHVVHFSGHGGYDPQLAQGFLVFTDEAGRSDLVVASRLGATLASHPHLRLVILNACRGAMGVGRQVAHSVAGAIVHQGVPACVSMQFEVNDRAALPFAKAFHRGIVTHGDVEQATMDGRRAISEVPIERSGLLRSAEWVSVVLHLDAPGRVVIGGRGTDDDGAGGSVTSTERDVGPRVPATGDGRLRSVGWQTWELQYPTSLPVDDALERARRAVRACTDVRSESETPDGVELLIGGLFPGRWSAVQKITVSGVADGSGSTMSIVVAPNQTSLWDQGMHEQAAQRIAKYLNVST